MNWLAHIFISEDSIDYQLGNLLADPLKGRTWEGASRQLQAGFGMHAGIDAFTDSNALVLKSKSRLGSRGYLKGVIIDITYDYCLIKNWDQYSSVDLDSFINTFYQNANAAILKYPDNAREFVKRLIDYRVLTSYGSVEGLEQAFHRIDKRLSQRILSRESAAGYLPVVKREIAAIEEDFSRFFPQLVGYFKSKSGVSNSQHWLR